MSTENNLVELFTQTRSTFSLFSLMAIWRVIYFRHYIIMTHVIKSVLVVVFTHPNSLLLCWFTHSTQHTCGRSRGTEPSEWIAQPGKWHFLHGDGISVMNKMSTNELNPCGYTRYFSFANALTVKLFFLKLYSRFLVSLSYFKHSFFEILFHTVKLYPSIWIEWSDWHLCI